MHLAEICLQGRSTILSGLMQMQAVNRRQKFGGGATTSAEVLVFLRQTVHLSVGLSGAEAMPRFNEMANISRSVIGALRLLLIIRIITAAVVVSLLLVAAHLASNALLIIAMFAGTGVHMSNCSNLLLITMLTGAGIHMSLAVIVTSMIILGYILMLSTAGIYVSTTTSSSVIMSCMIGAIIRVVLDYRLLSSTSVLVILMIGRLIHIVLPGCVLMGLISSNSMFMSTMVATIMLIMFARFMLSPAIAMLVALVIIRIIVIIIIQHLRVPRCLRGLRCCIWDIAPEAVFMLVTAIALRAVVWLRHSLYSMIVSSVILAIILIVRFIH